MSVQVSLRSGPDSGPYLSLSECMSESKSKSEIDVQGFKGLSFSLYSILVMSCFMWSAALDRSGVLLSYSITSLA